jgi:pimeloyl-ACP methyl ester carboxylesterase
MMRRMITETLLDTGDLSLNLASGPPGGTPLLFLHGVTRCWQDFITLLPPLCQRWHPYALDFRGHGKSGRTPGRYRILDYAHDAADVLAALREPAVVFGHSLGALVAGIIAAEMPDRVRAVVLEDPPGPSVLRGLRQTPFAVLFRAMQPLAGHSRPLSDVTRELAEVRLPGLGNASVRFGDVRDATSIRFTARCLKDLDPAVFDQLLSGAWLEGYDGDHAWSGVRCPALLLCGEELRGGMLPRAEARTMAERMGDCTLIDVAGVGHLVHWLEAEATLRFTAGFLETV